VKAVLAVDPGRDKCGIALVKNGAVAHREIAPRASAIAAIVSLIERHSPDVIVVGDGTGSKALLTEIRSATRMPIELVDETFTSQKARTRFFRENPPAGIRRLIPIGLQTPPRPYDDYVAVILAEEYLSRNA